MTAHPEPDVRTENNHLRMELAEIRLRYANLLAAARATLTARRDDEGDPLAYLADELADHGQHPPVANGWPDPSRTRLADWLDGGHR